MTEETEEVRCEEEKVDFEATKYFMCWVGYLKPNIFFKINLFIVGCAAWPASSCPSPTDKGTSFPLEEAAQKTQDCVSILAFSSYGIRPEVLNLGSSKDQGVKEGWATHSTGTVDLVV